MSFLHAILIAILQGATELFPVSSLGHAVVLPALLGWNLDEHAASFLPFLVLLHLGTAAALLLYFWRDWWALGTGCLGLSDVHRVRESRHIALLLVIATIPAVVLGAALEHFFLRLFGAPVIAACFLAANGILLLAGERLRGRAADAPARAIATLSYTDALVIGLWQCLALLPGLSRSGATIVGGLLRGIDHAAAARFSFLIATPDYPGRDRQGGAKAAARGYSGGRVPDGVHRGSRRGHRGVREHGVPDALFRQQRPLGAEPVRLLLPGRRADQCRPARRRHPSGGLSMRRTASLLLAGAALLIGAAAPNLAAVPLSRMDLPWWHARFEAKQAELHAAGTIDLLWLGDSITQNFEREGPEPWRDFRPVWEHFYGGRHAINLGFKGDATSHLLWRMEHGELDGLHPKAAIVLIGANNFGKLHWAARPTLAGIDAIVAELHRRLPETRILLLGVLPSIRNPWVDANTVELNRALAARYGAPGSGVVFEDLSALFMRQGRINAGAFLDPLLSPPDPPLHPTAQTQARMAEAIEPVVSRMLGDRPRPAM